MRSLILLALSLAVATAVPRNPQRIVGGSTTTISQYPSIAALLYSRLATTYWQACGGTIINTRSILTAAHCTSGDTANQWRVRVGSTYANSNGDTGVVHSVSQIMNHPGFSWSTAADDIAVMRTVSAISYNINVNAAFVASSTYNLADNQVVWAAGWGTTSENGAASETLRHVQLWTVNQNTCRNNYAGVGWTITNNMVCSGYLGVGGRDQCQGDSGGPLYHNNILVGVCSFGHGCGRANYPGVNTRVSSYASWISANA